MKVSTRKRPRKKPVKRIGKFDRKLLTHIVFSKHLPIPSNELKKALGISRQLLNYHMKKLTDIGLTRVAVRDAQNFYEPTERGKKFFTKEPSAGVIAPVLGLHNIAFKFKLLGGKDFRLKQTTTLRGWIKHHCFFDGCYVEKTTQNLIICPIRKGERLKGTDPFKLQQEARDKAMSIAQHFIDRHDLTLSKPTICRKPHFGVQDPVARALTFEVSTKDAKYDDSEGTGGEIDFLTPQGAKSYLDTVTTLPGRVDKLDNSLEKILNVMEKQAEQLAVYGEHLNAHIPVLKGMDKLLKNLDSKIGQTNIMEFSSRKGLLSPREEKYLAGLTLEGRQKKPEQEGPKPEQKAPKSEQEEHYVTF